jgi:hypothetical protein
MSLKFRIGARRALNGALKGAYDLLADELVTHGVIVGMTGSGKTGVVTVMVEEALRAGVPVLMVDVKGDLANLALAFPSFDEAPLRPWVEAARGDDDDIADAPLVAEVAEQRRRAFSEWSITESDLQDYCDRTHVRIVTPGSDAGEPLHLLSALERRSSRWDTDADASPDVAASKPRQNG